MATPPLNTLGRTCPHCNANGGENAEPHADWCPFTMAQNSRAVSALGDIDAYEAGAKACQDGAPMATCPFTAGTEAYAEWSQGWLDARAATMEPASMPPCPGCGVAYGERHKDGCPVMLDNMQANALPGDRRTAVPRSPKPLAQTKAANEGFVRFLWLVFLMAVMWRFTDVAFRDMHSQLGEGIALALVALHALGQTVRQRP